MKQLLLLLTILGMFFIAPQLVMANPLPIPCCSPNSPFVSCRECLSEEQEEQEKQVEIKYINEMRTNEGLIEKGGTFYERLTKTQFFIIISLVSLIIVTLIVVFIVRYIKKIK
jgi:hypothetical protein